MTSCPVTTARPDISRLSCKPVGIGVYSVKSASMSGYFNLQPSIPRGPKRYLPCVFTVSETRPRDVKVQTSWSFTPKTAMSVAGVCETPGTGQHYATLRATHTPQQQLIIQQDTSTQNNRQTTLWASDFYMVCHVSSCLTSQFPTFILLASARFRQPQR